MAKIIEWTKEADSYRGDMSCIEILTPHKVAFRHDLEGEIKDILVDGEAVCRVESWYGSNGQGKLAAQDIIWVAPGWELKYVEKED